MYDVLIADDEFIVREGMKNKIKWGELGFNCVYTACDGRDAMEQIEKYSPHLVITDIYMPFIDGLQLAEYLYENFPRIKIIILTGFDDFDYVRKALKYKVQDYILKPITSAELIVLLKKIKNELDSEVEEKLEIQKLKSLLDEHKPVIKERFLNRLIKAGMIEGGLSQKLDFFEIGSPLGGYCVAVIDVDSPPDGGKEFGEYGNELLYYSVLNVSEELVTSLSEESGICCGTVFQNALSQTVIIFWGDNSVKNSDDILKKIALTMPKILNFTITIGVSRFFDDVSKISIHYNEAVAALEHRFIMGNNRIIKSGEIKRASYRSEYSCEEDESKIITAIKTDEPDILNKNITELFEKIRQSEMTVEECYGVIQHLLFKIQNIIMQLEIDINKIASIKTNIIVDLYRYKTLDEIMDWLLALCSAINEYLASRRDSYSKTLVAKAQEYINRNYANKEISVNSVSKHLSISGSYFSSIFKSHTQETFTEYLTGIRLERAKELLKTTSLKTYEISDEVGYTDSHYFSILFKKHIGITPTAYRDKTK